MPQCLPSPALAIARAPSPASGGGEPSGADVPYAKALSTSGGESPSEIADAPQSDAAASLAAAADNSAIERLERALLKELATVERMRASLKAEPLRPMDAERTARTLSVLTETLAKLRRLRLAAQPQQDTPDDILDIDEFRRDLARRIEAFVASQPDDECPDGDRNLALGAPRP
jgi:hypothetical protein